MNIDTDITRAVTNEVAKSAYPVIVASSTVLGIGLQDWVYVTAIAYAALQSGFLVWKWARMWRESKTVTIHFPSED